jgi:hypothetical protein
MSTNPIRVAFVKFGGMTIGGSELWLQKIAVNLPKDKVLVDYYYCDDAPFIGGEHTLAATSAERIRYVEDAGIKVIRFSVGAKNIRTLTHDWVDTDFWEKFDATQYDIVQTVKAGPKEYPFYKMNIPVVEIVALANRPDTSNNIAWSFHSSGWQRARWVRQGGQADKSSVLSAPVEKPLSTENYRSELGIPKGAIVAGFHQRNDNLIASEIPLAAFNALQKGYPDESKNWHFIIKNGGSFYRTQAEELGLTNIHFLPSTPDSTSVSKFLNTLDIFAHGRKDGETFGAIFVEAMLHGKPCLTHYSPTGANAQPETMGPAGMFAMTQKDYEEDLYKLFHDAVFREKLASKAAVHANTYYSMEMCISTLVNTYQKIVHNNESISSTHHAIPYGYSDLGFLYAGNSDSLQSLASHVVTGEIPEPDTLAVVQALLPFTKTFLDRNHSTGLYGWIAAHYYEKNKVRDGHVTVYEPNSEQMEVLSTTRFLNNWEDYITLTDTIPSSNQKMDCVTLLTTTHRDEVKTIMDHALRNQSILLVRTHKDIRHYLTQHGEHYHFFMCKKGDVQEIKNTHIPTDHAVLLLLPNSFSSKNIETFKETMRAYRKEHFVLFGLIRKTTLMNYIHTIIPPYITPKKVITYIRRMLRIA